MKTTKRSILFSAAVLGIFCLVLPAHGLDEKNVSTVKVKESPVIDGSDADACWASPQEVVTHDKVADIDVSLKCVYTNDRIFFLVRFQDPDESRTHRSWVWNKEQGRYKGGPEREDVFVFKWFLGDRPADITLASDTGHVADVWFWKANRTDPAGYADDKIDRLSESQIPESKPLTSKSGKTMHLARLGDEGEPCYRETLFLDREKDTMPRYERQTPSGSLADIKAKGQWHDGRWTIEFSRALQTGRSDDVQFDVSQAYLFGISRYEISGREPEPDTTQPLYGCGDLSERLNLVFSK